MTHESIDLSRAGVGNFTRGKSKFTEAIWIIVSSLIIDNRVVVFSRLRVFLLRLFGAKIGNNCRMVQATRIKFPWKLQIGHNTWIGDGVVISNHGDVVIGNNVCISQETFITSGSHRVDIDMELIVAPVTIKDGAWISSRCVIQKGVTIGTNAVVTPNSVVNKSLAEDSIFGGNPCKFIRARWPASTAPITTG